MSTRLDDFRIRQEGRLEQLEEATARWRRVADVLLSSSWGSHTDWPALESCDELVTSLRAHEEAREEIANFEAQRQQVAVAAKKRLAQLGLASEAPSAEASFAAIRRQLPATEVRLGGIELRAQLVAGCGWLAFALVVALLWPLWLVAAIVLPVIPVWFVARLMSSRSVVITPRAIRFDRRTYALGDVQTTVLQGSTLRLELRDGSVAELALGAQATEVVTALEERSLRVRHRS